MSETSNTELIEEARSRITANRLGRSWARETDKDLIVINRLADALENAETLIDEVAASIAGISRLSTKDQLANIRAAITNYDQERES